MPMVKFIKSIFSPTLSLPDIDINAPIRKILSKLPSEKLFERIDDIWLVRRNRSELTSYEEVGTKLTSISKLARRIPTTSDMQVKLTKKFNNIRTLCYQDGHQTERGFENEYSIGLFDVIPDEDRYTDRISIHISTFNDEWYVTRFTKTHPITHNTEELTFKCDTIQGVTQVSLMFRQLTDLDWTTKRHL